MHKRALRKKNMIFWRVLSSLGRFGSVWSWPACLLPCSRISHVVRMDGWMDGHDYVGKCILILDNKSFENVLLNCLTGHASEPERTLSLIKPNKAKD
jgi:hypothetical protein